MTIRTKRRRRLLFLTLLAILILGGGGVLYGYREAAIDAEAREAREAGLEAFEQGAYSRAVEELSRFLRRLDPDALALLRYAQAIRKLPEADSEHLSAAVSALRRCVKLEPQNQEARRVLLSLFMESGARTEAIGQADWLLAHDSSDQEALLAKVRMLAQMNRYEKALEELDRRIGPESPLLDEHLLRVSLMAMLEEPPAKILMRARAGEEANPYDPRYGLVLGHARLLVGDIAGAREALKPLVAIAKDDDSFARLLLPFLDAAGLPQDVLTVLATLDVGELGLGLREELVKRLWQAGEVSAIPRRIRSWHVEPQKLSTAVLGYGVLALSRLGREEEAGRFLAILENRTEQDSAKGWIRLIGGVVLPESPSIRSRIDACLAAIELDPDNSQSWLELGLAYRDAGEPELAVRELKQAGASSPSWAEPAAVAARLLLQTGRLRDAVHAASAASALHSEDPGVELLLRLARSAADEAADQPVLERMLSGLERDGVPVGEALSVRLALLAATGRKGDATDLLDESLGTGRSLAGDVLLGCALLSQEHGLGLEQRCLARYEEVHGSTPELALVLAGHRAISEGAAAGRAILRERRQAANDENTQLWDVAEARYGEAHGTPEEALRAWRLAVEGGGAEPSLLIRVLEADSTWADREFIRKCIDALRDTTGESCLRWRLYDAKFELTETGADPSSLDAPMSRLRGILVDAPKMARAHLLLAQAYERRGQPGDALEQLLGARANLGYSAPLDLEVARLQLALGDSASARAVLNGVRDAGPEASESLHLAELYTAAGEFEQAESMVQQALAWGESRQALLLAAALAGFRGHPGDEAALLARLSALAPEPLERARLLAGHFRRVGNLDAAEEHLRQAVVSDGAEPQDWLQLLSCLVLLGEPDEVLDTLEQAQERGALSQGTDRAALSTDLLRAAAETKGLRRLGAAYVAELTRRPIAEKALRILVAWAPTAPSVADQAQLRSLARSNPDYLDLQMAAAERYAEAGLFEDALTICERAVRRFPASPEPARSLALCNRAMGRAQAAAKAARLWRARTIGPPMEPDYFLAEQATPARAAMLLSPYVGAARARGLTDLLTLYGQAMIRSGQADRLEVLIAPHLNSYPSLAPVWAFLAGTLASEGDPERARQWLMHDALRTSSTTGLDLRIELAAAWAAMASAADSPEAREASRLHLRNLPRGGALSARQWERAGKIHKANRDTPLAEEAYRKALATEPPRLEALNNLAMILARSERAREALPLAERLIDLAPNEALYRDTLAVVRIQMGDLAGGLRALEKCRKIEPQNARWALRIVEELARQGDLEAAKGKLETFRDIYPKDDMAPQVRDAWSALERSFERPR